MDVEEDKAEDNMADFIKSQRKPARQKKLDYSIGWAKNFAEMTDLIAKKRCTYNIRLMGFNVLFKMHEDKVTLLMVIYPDIKLTFINTATFIEVDEAPKTPTASGKKRKEKEVDPADDADEKTGKKQKKEGEAE